MTRPLRPTGAQRADVVRVLALVAARPVPGDEDDQAATVTVRRARLFDLYADTASAPALSRKIFTAVLDALTTDLARSTTSLDVGKRAPVLHQHTGYGSTALVTISREGSWYLDGDALDRDALVDGLDTDEPLDEDLALPAPDDWSEWDDALADEDEEPDRVCSRCRETLPADAFALRRTGSDRRQSRCRACAVEAQRVARAEARRAAYLPRIPSQRAHEPSAEDVDLLARADAEEAAHRAEILRQRAERLAQADADEAQRQRVRAERERVCSACGATFLAPYTDPDAGRCEACQAEDLASTSAWSPAPVSLLAIHGL